MIRDLYIANLAIEKNSINRSAEVDVALGIPQGAAVTLDIATGKITLPADAAAAQAAVHIVIETDSGKLQYDSYVESFTGTSLKFANGTLVRLFTLGSLKGPGVVALNVAEAIVGTPDGVAVGDSLIPQLDGSWDEGVVTSYAYYLKVLEITENERGKVFHCEVVEA